jgi:hypothetical protein
LSILSAREEPYEFTYYDEPFYFVFRLCQDLSRDDVGNATNVDLLDVVGVRCNASNLSSCADFLSEAVLDWKFIDPTSPDRGVIFYAEGDPFFDRWHSNPETLDFQFIIYCDSKVTDPNVEPTFIYAHDDFETSLTARIFHAVGCPTAVPSPTPTPTPWEPSCRFVRRDPQQPSFGLDVDFAQFNSGPYGSRFPVWVNDTEMIVFFQVCERADCPLGYACPSDSTSSAWLCEHHRGNRNCLSFGLATEKLHADLIDNSSASAGVRVSIRRDTQSSIQTSADVTCDGLVPLGHIFWLNEALLVNDTLTIKGRSQSLCSDWLPTPTPGGNCTYFDVTSQGQRVALSLAAYNKISGGADVGWNVTVSVSGAVYLLRYEPCGGMFCPPETFCDGDEDATVWLCWDEGTTNQSFNQCTGFGLFGSDFHMRFLNPDDATAGVNVRYAGSIHRFANVTWLCDGTIPAGELRLGNTFDKVDNTLSFNVWAADACFLVPSMSPASSAFRTPAPSPFMTPAASPFRTPNGWLPRPPSPGKTPTPTPAPSPNPADIAHNGTHYVLIQLDLYQELYSGTNSMTGPGPSDSLLPFVVWQPWTLQDCPSGCRCNAVQANCWICWNTSDGSGFCHAAADVRISNSIEPLEDWNDGLWVRIAGVFGTGTHIHSSCDQTNRGPIEFTRSTLFEWAADSIVRVNTSSLGACPRPFDAPWDQKSVGPTPTPDPRFKARYEASFTDANGDAVQLFLDRLPDVHQTVAVGLSSFELDEIYFHPFKPQKAPGSYHVRDESTDRVANAWRCVRPPGAVSPYCGSIGHADFGLEQTMLGDTADSGIGATYPGGLGGASLHMQFVCDWTVPHGTYVVDDVGTMTLMHVFVLSAHSRMFCPNYFRGLNGGALFLLIVLIAFIGYVTGGVVIRFMSSKTIEFPNPDFWEEVKDSIATAVLFLLSFGTKRGEKLTPDQPASKASIVTRGGEVFERQPRVQIFS